MKPVSLYLHNLEQSPVLLASVIRNTEISEVLGKIARLEFIPREGELHIKKWAASLLQKLHITLNAKNEALTTSTKETEIGIAPVKESVSQLFNKLPGPCDDSLKGREQEASTTSDEPLVIDLTEEVNQSLLVSQQVSMKGSVNPGFQERCS